MKVTMNPLALSYLLSDLSVGPDEVEGVLIGETTTLTSTTIQDYAADHVHDSIQLNITGHFSLQVGSAVEVKDKLVVRTPLLATGEMRWTSNPYLSFLKRESLVGWFRFSSRPAFAPNVPSIQDQHKDQLLRRLLPEDEPFVFLSLSTSFNERHQEGINGFDRTLFRLKRIGDTRVVAENIELLIPNLGDTEATKRYTRPLPDVGGPLATRFDKNIVEKQSNFLTDLKRYGFQRVEHCQGVFQQYVESYESVEGPLSREILQLEKQLEDLCKSNLANDVNSDASTNDDIGNKNNDKNDDSNHSDGGIDQEESLPSPAIENTQKTEQLQDRSFDDSEDIIPATQFDDSYLTDDQESGGAEEKRKEKEAAEKRKSESAGKSDKAEVDAGDPGTSNGVGRKGEENQAKKRKLDAGAGDGYDEEAGGTAYRSGGLKSRIKSTKEQLDACFRENSKGKNRDAAVAAHTKSEPVNQENDNQTSANGRRKEKVDKGDADDVVRKNTRGREKSPPI